MMRNNKKLDLKVAIVSFFAGSVATIFLLLLFAFFVGTLDIDISLGDNDESNTALDYDKEEYEEYIKVCMMFGGEIEYCNCLYESEIDETIDCSDF